MDEGFVNYIKFAFCEFEPRLLPAVAVMYVSKILVLIFLLQESNCIENDYNFFKKIKSIYARYYAKACNEWQGPSPRLAGSISAAGRVHLHGWQGPSPRLAGSISAAGRVHLRGWQGPSPRLAGSISAA